eukprot:TRINITY_DN28756_c0_g1_i2.p1 TRINITY_DN28756_c0_g1~~TRINITY_DN28756_c0_g1_i2.p1  ORF type:complete len:314 (-),score=89.96 TRINITY_DN28756_c0_g1_i2:7-948(-)
MCCGLFFFFFFKQKTAYEMQRGLVGSEMCIRDRYMGLAFATGAGGKGALKLWPLFGAVNQTLAALALIIITVYLKGKGGIKWVVAGIPSVFMVFMTIWALILNQTKFGTQHNLLLQTVNAIILVIAVWISIEGALKFWSINGVIDEDTETEDLGFTSVKGDASQMSFVNQLKKIYYWMTGPALAGLVVSEGAKALGLIFPWAVGKGVQALCLVVCAGSCFAAPLMMRTLFAHSLKDSHGARADQFFMSVSYTHLTLPTILLVQISVVAVSLKKKKPKKKSREEGKGALEGHIRRRAQNERDASQKDRQRVKDG